MSTIVDDRGRQQEYSYASRRSSADGNRNLFVKNGIVKNSDGIDSIKISLSSDGSDYGVIELNKFFDCVERALGADITVVLKP